MNPKVPRCPCIAPSRRGTVSRMDLQVKATAMEVREILGIGRVSNSGNFFGRSHFRFVFSIVATLRTFHLVWVFHHIIVFRLVLSCRRRLSRCRSASCFDLIPCFQYYDIPKRPQRHPVGSQAAVPGRNGKRLPALSGGTTVVPDKNGR